MAEKIEFIPANELPVAEGDEVSVLCLENGEMKQKPGASLGGSGAEPDMVLTITELDPLSLEVTADNLEIVSGSIEDLCNKLREDKKPIVKMIHSCINETNIVLSTEYIATANIYNEWVYVSYVAYTQYGMPVWCGIVLNLDGSFNSFNSYALVPD